MEQAEPREIGGGRYSIAFKLGEGGMAQVYRAWDQRLQVWRAIKVLHPSFTARESVRRRFEAEAHALARLEHDNIVRIYDVGFDGEHAFIVMELADGGSPVDWMERHGPMPPRLAVTVTMEVCAGIAAAHAEGIIHRDIKPQNILVTRKGTCRVSDFGIAQVDMDDHTLTKTGTVMGTLGYMAPEQRADAKHVDARADVYSLAATLFALVTRRTSMDLFAAVQDPAMLVGVPKKMVPIIVKGTQYRPDDRYQTVIEFAEALDAIYDSLPEDPPGTPSLVIPRSETPIAPPTRTTGGIISIDSFPDRPSPIANPTILPRTADATMDLPSDDAADKRQPWSWAMEEREGGQPDANPAEQDKYGHLYVDEPRNPRKDDREWAEPEDDEQDPIDIGGDGGIRWAFKAMWKFVVQLITILFKFVVGPGKYILIPLAAVFLAIIGSFSYGASTLSPHTDQADRAWRTWERRVDTHGDAILEDLDRAERKVPAASFALAEFKKAEGDKRKKAAFDYTKAVAREITMIESSPELRDHPTLPDLKARLAELTNARGTYEASVAEWDVAAGGGFAQVAVQAGFASRPYLP